MRKMKNLFSTPKRTVISIAVMAAALGVVGAGTALGVRIAARSNSIGSASAEQIALADAGAEVAEARFQETEFSYEDGQFVYEVEFFTDLGEYEYTIAADDGDILWREWDLNDTAQAAAASISSTTVTAITDAAEETTATTTTTAAENITTATTTVAAENSAAATTTAAAQISLDDAKTIALADADVANSDVTFTKEKLDRENGTWYYDLEFYTTDTEYDYEINAETGEIDSKEIDALRSSANSSSTNVAVELETAKNTALKDADVSNSDVTFTKEKLDRENGTWYYDLEFYSTDTEYDYEINAETGEISNKKVKSILNESTGGDYIGIDAAKEIALNDVGISADDVTFTKAKLEKEDGVAVYEIEFISGTTEYDYTIQAADGAILEYDIDRS